MEYLFIGLGIVVAYIVTMFFAGAIVGATRMKRDKEMFESAIAAEDNNKKDWISPEEWRAKVKKWESEAE